MDSLNLKNQPGYITEATFENGVCTIVTAGGIYETPMSNTVWVSWKASPHPQNHYLVAVEPHHTWKTKAVRRYN